MSNVNLIHSYNKDTYEVKLNGDVFKCIHENNTMYGDSIWHVMDDEGILFDDSFHPIFRTIKDMCQQYLLTKKS
jgi:hypothetical protein